MMLLSKLLYLFRTLPIQLPHTYLKSLQSIMHIYVCQGMKARCSHARLIKQTGTWNRRYRHKGLLYRHHTVTTGRLDVLSPKTLSGNIEATMVPGSNFKTWLFSTAINPPGLKSLSPTIQVVVNAWKSLLSSKWLHLPIKSLPISLKSLQLLSPQT